LHPEGHRRPAADFPAAGADDLIPVAHAGRPDLDQHLVLGEGAWPRHLDQLDIATSVSDSGDAHGGTSSSFVAPGTRAYQIFRSPAELREVFPGARRRDVFPDVAEDLTQ